jgi:hypothetical protein
MASTELVVPDEAVLAEPAQGLSYIIDVAPSFEVNDESDLETASEMLGQVAAALKEIEAQRKELTGPLNTVVKKLNAAAKNAAKGLDTASLQLRSSIKGFHERQAQARAAAEAQARASSQQKVTDPGLLPAVAERKVTTSTGSVGSRQRWTFEVVDVQALIKAAAADEGLQDYLLVHTQLVNQFVKQGGRELPGVRIYETADVVVR